MAKKKKKKKVIARKRAQAKAKTKPKKKRIGKSEADDYELPINLTPRPAISEIKAPAGFRSISLSQAMLEYAEPLMDFVDRGVVKDLNEALQLGLPLWNYDIIKENEDPASLERKLVRQIQKTLKMQESEAREFFNMMMERKEYLFPPEIQPDDPIVLFIRKEQPHLLSPFNYDALNISDVEYVPEQEDRELVQAINKMDAFIAEDTEYDKWEDLYFSMLEKCNERYKNWLIFKGLDRYSEDFPFHVEIFLDFTYHYTHPEPITLKKMPLFYVQEFFADYLLRKMLAEPHEYLEWPPALKLFYQFLTDIGYMKSAKRIIKNLDRIEPWFLQILRERYS